MHTAGATQRLLGNADYCKVRAAETRTLAEGMDVPDARHLMLEIAEKYEQMAANAERPTGKGPLGKRESPADMRRS